MATKAEKFRYDEERKHDKAKKPAAKPKRPKPAERENRLTSDHAGKKATYAQEEPREGAPSRKSTRKSANRSKPDTNLNLKEAMVKGTPTAKARKARAKNVKVRGHSK